MGVVQDLKPLARLPFLSVVFHKGSKKLQWKNAPEENSGNQSQKRQGL